MDQPGNHILLRGNQPGPADRMRELLARTVQDHVADQRSNASALEDIRQRIEGLEWLVKEVHEQEIPGLADRLNSLAQHLDETAQRPPPWAESLAEHVGQALDALRAQDEHLSRLQQNINELHRSMESAAGRFSRLDQAVAELGQRTGQFGKEISAVKDQAEVGFSTLDERLADTDGTLGAIDGTLGAIDGTLGAIDGKLGAIDGKLGSTDARVAALDTRLERLDERLDDQYDRVSAIDNTLVAADTKLGMIGNALADHRHQNRPGRGHPGGRRHQARRA
jgi:chromosome segregation ATPase